MRFRAYNLADNLADNLAYNLAYNHIIMSVIIVIIIRDNNRSIQLALARNENLWIKKLTKVCKPMDGIRRSVLMLVGQIGALSAHS